MLSLLLVPAYAFADPFTGGSLGSWAKKLDDRLPGRAAFWGGVLVAGLGALLVSPWAALSGLFWWAYRIPKWSLFGGSATPVGAKAIFLTFLRHALIIPFGPLVAFWAGEPVLPATLAYGAYALAATGLAALYGRYNAELVAAGGTMADDDPFNTRLELCRGALFGAAVAFSL